MVPIRYHWRHIPTDKSGQAYFNSRIRSSIVAFKTVNQWNAAAPGVWQYWIDTGDVWTYHLRPDEDKLTVPLD